MGYRNEIYRADAVPVPVRPAAGSFCVPASLREGQQRGWDFFAGLARGENAATRVNAKDSSIHGLSYALHICQEGAGTLACEKIFLRIDSWRYDRFGETTDLPVMEMIFDSDRFSTPALALESLKIMARPLRLTEKIGTRAVNGALFLINQIDAGQVPDFERILELHRLHPDLGRSAERKTGKTENAVRAKAFSLEGAKRPAQGEFDRSNDGSSG